MSQLLDRKQVQEWKALTNYNKARSHQMITRLMARISLSTGKFKYLKNLLELAKTCQTNQFVNTHLWILELSQMMILNQTLVI